MKRCRSVALSAFLTLLLGLLSGLPIAAMPPQPLSVVGLRGRRPAAPSMTAASEFDPGAFYARSAPSAVQADAENLELVGHVGSDTSTVAVRGDYAYIGDEKTFAIVDISNPVWPTVVGQTAPMPTPGDVKDVAIHDDYAYVVTGRDGKLRVMDVSNPTSPSEIGSYQTPWWTSAVHFSEGYAYVANDWYGLRVIDVRDPTSPAEVGYLATSSPAWASGVHVSGDYAYLAAGGGGLQVVDVSDPTSPMIVSSRDTPGDASGVYVSEGYAYVTDGVEGLQVIDVNDPSHPITVGSCGTPGLAVDVYVGEDYAYVVDGEQGLRVVDVSDPTSPAEVGYYVTTGYSVDVQVNKGYAYVADYDGGLVILRYTDFSASGQVRDSNGDPVSNIGVSTAEGHSDITDADGTYTITGLRPGTHTIGPDYHGYLWSPDSRTVTIPPNATDQDFTGRSIRKRSSTITSDAVGYGDPLTYTVELASPHDQALAFYDPVPSLTSYISESLSAPVGVSYDPTDNVISGTLELSAGVPQTVSFGVRVEVTGTAESAPLIVNRACVYPSDGGLGDCEWSNEVVNFTYIWPVYLPLTMRTF